MKRIRFKENGMSGAQILHGKRAIVFGAGGSIGAAVAKEFAAAGAEVFLAGRTAQSLEIVAAQITSAGGRAHTTVVDVLDDAAVDAYVAHVAANAGGLDIVFNAVGPLASEYGNGKHAVDLTVDEFMTAATQVLKPEFITSRAAARQMKKQRSGVIVLLTGSPARGHVEGATAIGAAFGAIEALTENLAVELGPSGVRVVCVRTTANADSRTIQETSDLLASRTHVTPDQFLAGLAGMNFLKTRATVQDTARAAVLVASDYARMLTGTVANFTAGAALS
jgi:NAD(P)-dependent dehydrogenase (short-subunit alcohol dehydrogenase family)